jgi:hypothetical protein
LLKDYKKICCFKGYNEIRKQLYGQFNKKEKEKKKEKKKEKII